jgi:hypothetical protein
MDEHDSEAVDEAQPLDQEEAHALQRPAVTFMGNSYDLASLGALVTGLLSLFMCLSCNMGFYCLPFLPIVLGLIGLLSASQAVDSDRTRTWSWIGLGAGVFFLVLMAAAIVLYLALVIYFISAGERVYWQSFIALF